jgi:hypothetical protein
MFRITAMPSPRGTNHAGHFLVWRGRSPAMAFDSAGGLNEDPDLERITKVLNFLKGRLNGGDLSEVARLLGANEIDKGLRSTNDEPPPFKGMPEVGGSIVGGGRDKRAKDKQRRTRDDWLKDHGMSEDDVEEFEKLLEEEGYDEPALSTRLEGIDRRTHAMDSAAFKDFARRFPGVASIRLL